MNMQLNIPRHIHAETPHPCVLKLAGLRRNDLSFGKKFYEPGPDRMQGILAENIRSALHTQLTAVAFAYQDGEEGAVGDLVPLRAISCTSLPHADLSLRLLAMGEQRASTTLFTSRRDGLSALLKAWEEDEVEDAKLLSAYQQLKSFVDAPQPMGKDLYDPSTDHLAQITRDYANSWDRYIREDPLRIQKLQAYTGRVYLALDGNCYQHYWDTSSFVVFSPYGFHCKRSIGLEAIVNQDSPLRTKKISN